MRRIIYVRNPSIFRVRFMVLMRKELLTIKITLSGRVMAQLPFNRQPLVWDLNQIHQKVC